MKKGILATLLTTAVLLTACQVTKEVTVVNENSSAVEAVVDEEIYDEELSSDEDMEEAVEDIAEGELVDNEYTVSYSTDFFEEVDTSDTDDSLLIRCLVDPEHTHENYIDIQYEDEYTADDLYAGLVLQSGTDDVYTEDFLFGEQEIPCSFLSYYVSDEFMISFYIIAHNEGAYVIEVGNFIYPEDDSLGYKVSGYMEEVINSIKVAVE